MAREERIDFLARSFARNKKATIMMKGFQGLTLGKFMVEF